MREAAARGCWLVSCAPYGYSRVLVPDGGKVVSHDRLRRRVW